jgi:hypothetical protein
MTSGPPPLRTVPDTERRARLAVRHALAHQHRVDTVEAAVEAMTCLHATEPANVFLSAHARSGATAGDVRRALHDDRTVVLQLAMRRTVFAFPRDLLPAVLGSAAARVAAQLTTRLAKEVEQNGLADDGAAWVAATCAQVREALVGTPATTQQLREALPALALRIETAPGKAYGAEIPIGPRVLSVLAADGSILRGAPAAGWKVSRPYWTTAGEWLGGAVEPLTAREGYATLVRRWLWSFGPGTEDDLVWWLGATKAAVRSALADVGAVPVALEDGTAAWLDPEDTAEVEGPAPWAALLPALDPTTMGWKGRGFHLGDLAPHLFDRNGNGGPSAWWDGRVVGGWTQRDDGTVVVVPAGDLPRAARRPLADEAERLTAWLDGDVVRSIYQSPLVRAHDAAHPS